MHTRRVEPGPGQESVWDYPRPPRVDEAKRPVRVLFAGAELARSGHAKRVCETAGAPVYYIPPEDVRREHLKPASGGTTLCEWKGVATYYDVKVGDAVSRRAAWTYHDPTPGYRTIKDHVAFYAGRVDEAWVGTERAKPQPGGFYGGWVTSDVVGPFKGEPGTEGW